MEMEMEMEMAIKKGKKVMEMEMEMDFISELPVEILHHILSLLDMIDVVRTSALSKKWRSIWKSTHFLNFNEALFDLNNTSTSTSTTTDPFIDFVNKTLSKHNESNINTFSISGVDPRRFSRSSAWTLIWRSDNHKNRRKLDLPMCFFISKTLTSLKLDMGSKKGRQVFKIPKNLLGLVDLPCLKTLHLGSFLFVDGDSISEFISKCLGLDTLIIRSCLLEEGNDLTIHGGLHLNTLELGISCARTTTCIGDDNNAKITVFAPNLKYFKCKDLVLSEFYLDLNNPSALHYADLMNVCLLSIPDRLWKCSPNYSPQLEEEYKQNVFNCLRSICTVKSLSLDMHLLAAGQDKIPSNFRFEGLLHPFCNLRFLQLKAMFSTQHHIMIIAVLELCPFLQTLELARGVGEITRPLGKQISSEEMDVVNELWETKAPFQCMSRYLRFVEIRDIVGTLDEFKFVRFLLKNAAMLVNLDIVLSYLCRPGSDYKECIEEFQMKLAALPKASSSVEILFFPQD